MKKIYSILSEMDERRGDNLCTLTWESADKPKRMELLRHMRIARKMALIDAVVQRMGKQ